MLSGGLLQRGVMFEGLLLQWKQSYHVKIILEIMFIVSAINKT